jgi:hypothetical protein
MTEQFSPPDPVQPTGELGAKLGPDITKIVETITKTSAMLAVFSYVCGLLVVNVYLFRYGVSDFSIVKPRYVFTGVAATLFFGVSVAFIGGFGWYFGRASPRVRTDTVGLRQLGRILRWSTRLLVFVVYAMMILVPAQDRLGFLPNWITSVPLQAVGTIVPLIVVAAAYEAGQVLGREPMGATRRAVVRRFARENALHLALLALLVFLTYIQLFAATLYPTLPEQLGGGRPSHVRLLIAPEATAGVRDLGVSIAVGGSLSDPVSLLFEGTETYTLRAGPEGKIVQVDKKQVRGLRFED